MNFVYHHTSGVAIGSTLGEVENLDWTCLIGLPALMLAQPLIPSELTPFPSRTAGLTRLSTRSSRHGWPVPALSLAGPLNLPLRSCVLLAQLLCTRLLKWICLGLYATRYQVLEPLLVCGSVM